MGVTVSGTPAVAILSHLLLCGFDWVAQAMEFVTDGPSFSAWIWRNGTRERFDEATARWCFARLPAPGDDPGWLHGQQAEWRESGQSWEAWLRSWAQAEGMHAGLDIVDGLDARFDREALAFWPYFFPDLAGTSEADEQAAIDAGLIKANRIDYAGRRRSKRAA